MYHHKCIHVVIHLHIAPLCTLLNSLSYTKKKHYFLWGREKQKPVVSAFCMSRSPLTWVSVHQCILLTNFLTFGINSWLIGKGVWKVNMPLNTMIYLFGHSSQNLSHCSKSLQLMIIYESCIFSPPTLRIV